MKTVEAAAIVLAAFAAQAPAAREARIASGNAHLPQAAQLRIPTLVIYVGEIGELVDW
jgi:hypothetical protein